MHIVLNKYFYFIYLKYTEFVISGGRNVHILYLKVSIQNVFKLLF